MMSLWRLVISPSVCSDQNFFFSLASVFLSSFRMFVESSQLEHKKMSSDLGTSSCNEKMGEMDTGRAAGSTNRDGHRLDELARMVAIARADDRVELETRIGVCRGLGFKSGIARDHMDQLIELMDEHALERDSTLRCLDREWVETEDYIFVDEAGRRLRTRVTYGNEGMSATTVHKRKLRDVTLRTRRAAIRVSASLEDEIVASSSGASLPVAVRPSHVRIKQTRRFACTNSPFIVSCFMVWEGSSFEEAERQQASDEPTFEVECELSQHDETRRSYLMKHSDRYVARSLLCKTMDLML